MDAQIEISNLKERIDSLELLIFQLIKPSGYVFNKAITIADGLDITTNTSTGTKLPALATQKLGFWGVTPIVQPSAISAPAGGATIDSQSRTAITSIISTLQSLGLTA